MYKRPNFTTLSDLSKIVKTHSKTELKRIANRIDDLALRPEDRRRLGVAEGTVMIYNEGDTELIDVAFHDTYILNILKYIEEGKEALDLPVNPFVTE
tara:strand:+ start:200 stop:490 length:291 start_codon:yes stop_codon:yes gene_type:complete